MATKVTMEALSPTMEEGRLVKWNKNEGAERAQSQLQAPLLQHLELQRRHVPRPHLRVRLPRHHPRATARVQARPRHRAGDSVHHRWRAGSPARRESSSVGSRAPARAAGSSSATSRTRKRLALPVVPQPPTDSRPKETSRTSPSLRSERRSRGASPSRTAPFRLSFSPPNTTSRAPRSSGAS